MLEFVVFDQVKEALDQCNRGQKYLYNTFTNNIKENQSNSEALIHLLDELRDNVDLFENAHEQFLDFLQLQINWSKQPKSVLDSFGAFLTNLISCNTKHAQRYLSFLFTLFAVPDSAMGEQYNQNCFPLYDFAHDTLRQLVQIVPLASTLLCPIAEQHFPFMTKDISVQLAYVKNLLKTLSYFPIQRQRFLEIIITKLLRLDVHASRQDIIREEKANAETELVFSLEQLDTNGNDGMRHDVGDKLDCLMLVMFNYIMKTSFTNETLDYEQAKSLFRDLLSIFGKVLLLTHDCSHVQFLLFYICSYHTDFSDEFINYCWKIFVSPSVSMTFRQAAVCYLCSLIARAKYIPIRSAMNITQLMVDWLHSYVSATEGNSGTSNPNRHLAFYAISQSVLYIFIYRHQEIVRLQDGIESLRQWRLGRVISSSLNPLKYCLPAIAHRFAQLARNYQIVFCYSIIETNNRYSLPEISDNNSCTYSSNILYTYFPFDPYLLKRSSNIIKPLYNDYKDDSDEIADKGTESIASDNDNEDLTDYFGTDEFLVPMSTTPLSGSANLFSTNHNGYFDTTSIGHNNKQQHILPFGRSPGFRSGS